MRTQEPCEILERRLCGTAWDQDTQLCYLSMKKSRRIWPVSEKIDGIEAPSSLKARFRNIYVSPDRDMKPDYRGRLEDTQRITAVVGCTCTHPR